MEIVFVASIIKYELRMIDVFFVVQQQFSTKNYFLIAEINLTTWGPLYTFFVFVRFRQVINLMRLWSALWYLRAKSPVFPRQIFAFEYVCLAQFHCICHYPTFTVHFRGKYFVRWFLKDSLNILSYLMPFLWRTQIILTQNLVGLS